MYSRQYYMYNSTRTEYPHSREWTNGEIILTTTFVDARNFLRIRCRNVCECFTNFVISVWLAVGRSLAQRSIVYSRRGGPMGGLPCSKGKGTKMQLLTLLHCWPRGNKHRQRRRDETTKKNKKKRQNQTHANIFFFFPLKHPKSKKHSDNTPPVVSWEPQEPSPHFSEPVPWTSR